MQSIDTTVKSRPASMLALWCYRRRSLRRSGGPNVPLRLQNCTRSTANPSSGTLQRLRIKCYVLAGAMPPRPVLLHAVANQLCPNRPVGKGLKSSFERLGKGGRRIGVETKAVCCPCRKRLLAQVRDRVGQTACVVYDRNRPVFQTIKLIKAARLIPTGHQEQVGTGLDSVGQLIGKREPDCQLLGIFSRQVGEPLMVLRLTPSEDHPLHIRLWCKLGNQLCDEIVSLLFGQPTDHCDHRLVRYERQS